MFINKKPLFNEFGDIETSKKRMINGNTTNLNDFNNMKYNWVSDWYRQAMNNFWIPEEINLAQDLKDYNKLTKEERTAYDKILSFLIFLDSIQTANLSNINSYITASEVNLCLTIQAFQEAVHSQSYSYMLDTICSPEKRNEILYQWKDDKILLERNKFIYEQLTIPFTIIRWDKWLFHTKFKNQRMIISDAYDNDEGCKYFFDLTIDQFLTRYQKNTNMLLDKES